MFRAISLITVVVACSLAAPAAAVEGAPAQRASTTSGLPPAPLYTSLVAAGDLNGDGRADLLDIRSAYSSSARYGITARDGRTGRALWDFRETKPLGDDMNAYVVPLGPQNKPGVIVVDQLYAEADSTETLELQALSGKSGTVLWTRTLTGHYDPDGTQHHLPSFAGIARNGPGHPARIVVESDSGNCNSQDCTSQALTILSTNGSRHNLGSPVKDASGYPRVQALPDVNGDGKDDVAIIYPGSPGYVMAENASTGKKIWKTAVADVETVYSQLVPLSSRGKPLFAYINSGPFPGPFTISLINSIGTLLWTRTTDSAATVSLAGPKLRPAVEMETVTDSQVNSVTYQATMTARAVGLGGHVLWTRAVAQAATNQTPGGPIGFEPELTPIGDVQPDGARESIMSLTVTNGDVSSSVNGVLDGRTGVLHLGPYQIGTDGSLHRGDATDLAAGTITSSHELRLRTWRGLTRKLYYSKTLANLSDIADEKLTGVRVTGHRCSDFALAATTPSAGDEDAVLSARGTILWTVRFAADKVVGGARTRGPAPTHYCVPST
jgi:hypothetical protein